MYTDNLFTSSQSRCHLFKMAAIASALLVGSLPLSVMAETASAAVQSYNIPAQPLDNALTELADDANLKLLYQADVVNSLKSQPLSGRYTPQQALEIMLQGTGLKSRTTDHGGITIEKDADIKTPTSQKTDPNTVTLKPTTVSAERRYASTDPYNPDYVLPNATAGTKTDTPIMETPLNVQVISKQVMKDQQVITLGDALKNVSGVTTAGNGFSGGGDGGIGTNQTLFLRGIFTNTIFRNGFRLQQGAGVRQMANVESVEVLKGSAAVLYGQVEPGGMVNVVTKQPLATPYYGFSQQFGSYDLYRTTFDATGPITENKDLLYRMNMSYENSGSFREFVGNEDVFVAPVLKWNISPRTQATVELEYNHQHKGLDAGGVPFLNGQLLNAPRSRNYGEYSPGTVESIYGSFNWSHQFNDDWSIKHSFAVNQQHDTTALFYPYSSDNVNVSRLFYAQDLQYNTYSTNLDLIGHFDTWGLKHTVLTGGDYYRLNTVQNLTYTLDPTALLGFSQTNLFNPSHPGTSFPAPPQSGYALSYQTDQYGLYAQDQIKLPYNIHVMGGIRYQYLHQLNVTNDQIFGGGLTSTAVSQDAVTPRVGIVWQPQSWLSLYANYTESFGANTGTIYPNKPIPASSANQYEGGIKTEFFGGRLRATLAYFDLTKNNISTGDPAHPGFSLATGAVRSRGPEMDIQGEILPGWNVIATYANIDARISKDSSTSEESSSPVGTRLYNVPRNTGSLWNTYELQNGQLKGFKFGGGVTLRDGQEACCDNAPRYKLGGYATVDMLAAYSFKVGKSKVSAQLNINNLLDKHYFSGISTFRDSTQMAWADFGQPRTFMGSINIQY